MPASDLHVHPQPLPRRVVGVWLAGRLAMGFLGHLLRGVALALATPLLVPQPLGDFLGVALVQGDLAALDALLHRGDGRDLRVQASHVLGGGRHQADGYGR